MSNANWIRMKILLPPSFTSLNCICFFFSTISCSAFFFLRRGDPRLKSQKPKRFNFPKNKNTSTLTQFKLPGAKWNMQMNEPYCIGTQCNEKWQTISIPKSIYSKNFIVNASNKYHHKILCTSDLRFPYLVVVEHCSMEFKTTANKKYGKKRLYSKHVSYLIHCINGITAAKGKQ